MIDPTPIRAALDARLATVSGLPPQHDYGTAFARPDAGAAYRRTTLLTGDARTEGIPVTAGRHVTEFEFQVTLFVPLTAAGLAQGEAWAKAICRAFRPGFPAGVLATSDPAVTVHLRESTQTNAVPDPATQRQFIVARVRGQSWEASA